ncbi:armadillo-like helical domain containing protein 1 [Xenentodon cancila]
MAAAHEHADIGRVLGFLREWDRGNGALRSRMLDAFLSRSAGKTFQELERDFASAASLFLARLTTWMKVLSIYGTFSGLLLKAIGIFLSASIDQYLLEFVEDGGVLTLLDIIGHSQRKEAHKTEALQLLLSISDAGVKEYKELICENHGVKVIADCLAISNADDPQQTAGALLESLSHGNPKYQDQIYQSLITLMTCLTTKSQQLVLRTIHNVQLKLKTADHSIVAPLLNMLSSHHLEVQDEAINLILDLRHYDVKAVLLSGLVALLRPIKEEVQQHQLSEEGEMIERTGSIPAFVQQAAAAKTIRLLAEADRELSHKLFYLGVIQHLLYAMGNREHADAQIQASLALRHFVQSFPRIATHVQKVMGSMLFAAFTLRRQLLSWYDEDKRELPWRTLV